MFPASTLTEGKARAASPPIRGRAKAIVAEEGGNLCLAARDQGDEQIPAASNTLGQTIIDALLEVSDGLTQD